MKPLNRIPYWFGAIPNVAATAGWAVGFVARSLPFAIVVAFSLTVGVAPSVAIADDGFDQSKRIAKIELLGGIVERDESRPNHPVIGITFLRNSDFNEKYLHLLMTFQNLKSLDLIDAAITDNGVKAIAQFTSLQRLELSGLQITDQSASELCKLKNLSELTLCGTAVTSVGKTMLTESCPLLDIADKRRPRNPKDEQTIQRLNELHAIVYNYRYPSEYPFGDYAMIGGLMTNPFWPKTFALEGEQAAAIRSLDRVVHDASGLSKRIDADYVEKTPADYKSYLKERDARRFEAVNHAERIVELGLLTEDQSAAFVSYLLSREWAAAHVRRPRFRHIMATTDEQHAKFEQILLRADNHNVKESNAETIAIFTPAQRQAWDYLTAEHPWPREPTELPLVPAAEKVSLAELSPLFSYLQADNAFARALSKDQRTWLADLEKIVQQGHYWIGLTRTRGPYVPGDPRNEANDPVGQTRREFLRAAERLVLLGILTQPQAEAVQEAIATGRPPAAE